jgi:teichoic acid transport system permease protein
VTDTGGPSAGPRARRTARTSGERAGRMPASERAGRISAPGELVHGDVGVLSVDLNDSLADLARRYGLRPSAERPSPPRYIRELWQRRHFMLAFATAQNIAMYTNAKLGQLWQVLTPLLNVAVYWLIFGKILDTSRGIPDYIPFLVVGVFVFNFTQRAFISTSKVIVDSLPLIRALQFPRAALPLAYVLIELQQMLIASAVMIVIILVSGEPVTWYWLLFIPALLLQSVFNAGTGMFVARVGAQLNDFSQLLPFLLRTWMYMSGVLFSLLTLTQEGFGHKYPWLVKLLYINPAAIYITLTRLALLQKQRESAPGAAPVNQALCAKWPDVTINGHVHEFLYNSKYCPPVINPALNWPMAIGWALLVMVVGFFFFWRAETRYGRG